MKKKSVFLLELCLLIGLTLVSVFNASAESYYGSCGDNAIWTLDSETGTMTISGSGKIKNNPSWNRKDDLIIKVIIKDGITGIGDYSFDNCKNLTSVSIPASVSSIGSSAFSGCNSLTGITIPNGVTSIGSYAFDDCSGLINLTILGSVTSLGNSAFRNCSALAAVTLSEGINSIGNSSFRNCTGLKSITIPESVKKIDNYAFYGCSDLISIMVLNKDCNINSLSNVFPNNAILCGHENSTLQKYAKRHNREFIVHTSHTYGPWKTIIASTCKAEGKKECSCTACGVSKVGPVAKSGHNYGAESKVDIPATFSSNGKLYKICSVCGYNKAETIYKIKSAALKKKSFNYNGKAQKPAVTVKDTKGNVLTNNKDYKVKYASGRKEPGKYKVSITFMGCYSGTKSLSFTISIPKVTGFKQTPKKGVHLKWNKVEGASGYEIYTNISGTSSYKYLGSAKNNSFGSDDARGSGVFKVRAYRTVKGKKVYGSFSNTLKVTAKK